MMGLAPHWGLERLDSIAEVRLGRQRSPKNHHGSQMRPYLRAANIDWHGLKLDDVKHMNFTDAEMHVYRLEPGDLVLSEASGSAGEVGKPALWRGEIKECAFQNTLLRVRSFGPDPEFLLHYFRYQAMSRAFANRARGVGIHHLGRGELASWLVPLPPLPEQRRIVEILDNYLSLLDAAEAAVRAASLRSNLLRGSLLQSAFSGRLTKPSADVKSIEEIPNV